METKLEILKHKLIQERDLSVPANYFLDHFPGKTQFEEQCKKIQTQEKQQLLAIIRTLVTKRLNIKQGKKMSVLLRYGKSEFIHGFVNFPNLLCTVVYFEKTMLGLVTCVKPSQMDRVEYFRITGFKSDNLIDIPTRGRIVSSASTQIH